VAAAVGERRAVTTVLEAPERVDVRPVPRAVRGHRVLLAGLLGATLLCFGVAALSAAPSTARLAPFAPAFGGSAQQVTLPSYGLQGMHVVGYRHGATVRLTLPVRNRGLLPLTVTSADLGGGVAPLLEVREVDGLPLSVPAGQTRSFEVTAQLANCKFFHEREVQTYPSVQLGVVVLGRTGTRAVPYDRPIMVHSPMIVGCPDRLLDRQGNDRSDLLRAS
jgi:hypothetical protein